MKSHSAVDFLFNESDEMDLFSFCVCGLISANESLISVFSPPQKLQYKQDFDQYTLSGRHRPRSPGPIRFRGSLNGSAKLSHQITHLLIFNYRTHLSNTQPADLLHHFAESRDPLTLFNTSMSGSADLGLDSEGLEFYLRFRGD
ncbi:hypothetical protein Tco_1369408 [Tanacetum coccineum]